MLGTLIILFTVVPLVEFYFLIQAADAFGGFNTFLIVILTGVIGAYLARTQGRHLLSSIQKKMAQNIVPTDEMIQGVMVLVAGILLVTPGFITDILGFLLVIPITRWIFIGIVKKAMIKRFKSSEFKVYTQPSNYSTKWEQEPTRDDIRDVTPKKLEDQ